MSVRVVDKSTKKMIDEYISDIKEEITEEGYSELEAQLIVHKTGFKELLTRNYEYYFHYMPYDTAIDLIKKFKDRTI